MSTIKIKTKYLFFTETVLKRLNLDVKDALVRRRFLKLLKPALLNAEIDRSDIIKQYCEKDEAGNLKVADGEYVFRSKEQRKTFEAVMTDELNDENEIDISGNELDTATVVAILTQEVVAAKKDKTQFTADEYEYIENINELILTLTV